MLLLLLKQQLSHSQTRGDGTPELAPAHRQASSCRRSHHSAVTRNLNSQGSDLHADLSEVVQRPEAMDVGEPGPTDSGAAASAAADEVSDTHEAADSPDSQPAASAAAANSAGRAAAGPDISEVPADRQAGQDATTSAEHDRSAAVASSAASSIYCAVARCRAVSTSDETWQKIPNKAAQSRDLWCRMVRFVW